MANLSDADLWGTSSAPGAPVYNDTQQSVTPGQAGLYGASPSDQSQPQGSPHNPFYLHPGTQVPPGAWYADQGGGVHQAGPQGLVAPTQPQAAPTPPQAGGMTDAQLWGQQGPQGAPAPQQQNLRPDEGLGFYQGVAHPMDNMSLWMDDGLRGVHLGGVADALDAGDRMLGGNAPGDALKHLDMVNAEAAAHGRKPGALGEFAGNALATTPIMLATGNPFVGGALAGAASTKDPHSLSGVLTDAAIGAVAGKAGDMVAGGAAKLIKPQLSDAVRGLIGEGVELTPGQITGGTLKTVEDASSHLPILGSLIKNAQRRGVQTFDRAAINRSLSPIGDKLPDGMTAGNDAVDYAASKLGEAFDGAKPKAPVVLGPDFDARLAATMAKAKVLPADKQAQLQSMIQSLVRDRAASGAIDPDAVPLLDRELRSAASKYGKSLDPDQQGIGNALDDVLGNFRDTVSGQDSGYASAIGKAREGWAHFVRVRRAASSLGAKEGVFSPNQLAAAVRGSDDSLAHGDFARGRALDQDLSGAGASVLPSSVPDSGTAMRGLMDMAALGALGAGEHVFHPHLAALAPLAAITAAYTPAGVKAARYMLAGSRPDWAQGVADAINQYGKPTAATLGTQASRLLSEALMQQSPQFAGASP